MRRTAFILAIGLCLLIWLGPLLDLYRSSFAAHMLAHMGVIACAAPLIALGVSGTRWDPSARYPMLFAAVPASILELAVVWGWHAPALRRLVETTVSATVAEQASFLAAGLFLWMSCFGYGVANRRRERSGAGAVGLLLTSAHMTLLGALLGLAPRPLYGGEPVTCLGITLSAEQDQQVGGVVMLLVGAIAYLAGGLVLLARMLEAPGSRPARREAGGR